MQENNNYNVNYSKARSDNDKGRAIYQYHSHFLFYSSNVSNNEIVYVLCIA